MSPQHLTTARAAAADDYSATVVLGNLVEQRTHALMLEMADRKCGDDHIDGRSLGQRLGEVVIEELDATRFGDGERPRLSFDPDQDEIARVPWRSLSAARDQGVTA